MATVDKDDALREQSFFAKGHTVVGFECHGNIPIVRRVLCYFSIECKHNLAFMCQMS